MGQRLENARSLYVEAIQDGDYERAINCYAGQRYTQHSTPVKDGRAGFIEFFADFVERNPIRDIEIVRGFEDGRHVFLQVVQNLNHGEYRYVTADIFDTDDEARLIEHWDVIAEVADETASGHSQVDGPTEPTDLDRTAQNKQLVTRFVDEVLVSGDYDRLEEFIIGDGTFVQHSPEVPDGVGPLRQFGLDAKMRYIELHNVIGCGDFVAALAESEIRGARYAVIDLFRISNGLMVEHWDVMEEIMPRDTWVNSGKF